MVGLMNFSVTFKLYNLQEKLQLSFTKINMLGVMRNGKEIIRGSKNGGLSFLL